MNIYIWLLIIAIALVALFYFLRFVIILWTGCTKDEAAKRIHNVMNPSSGTYHIAADSLLISEIWDIIHTAIGDARYNQIVQLSEHIPVFASGSASGLPYIAMAVPYCNANEKAQIESQARKIVERNLSVRGFTQSILVDWKFNPTLQMDMIMLRCAETPEEMEILKNTHSYNGKQLIKRNIPLRDEDIDND